MTTRALTAFLTVVAMAAAVAAPASASEPEAFVPVGELGEFPEPAPAGAFISTEHSDYSPGQTVDVTGGGWEPGETVTLLFSPDPQNRPNTTHTVTANEDGDFVSSEFLLQDEDLGTTYTITANGQSSGRTATASFTDAASDFYFAIGSGNWNTSTGVGVPNPVWKTCTNAAETTGCTTLGVTAPTTTANVIRIKSGVTVTATANLSVDQVVVASGGQVTVNSGVTMSLANGSLVDLTVDGTFSLTGTLTMAGSTDVVVNDTFSIQSGGLVNGGGGNGATIVDLDVTSGGDLSIASGGSFATTVNARITVASGGTATVNGSVSGLDTVTVSGSVDVPGGSISLGSISNLQVGGDLTLSGAATLSTIRGNGGSVGSINNGGTLTLSDTSQWSIGTVGTATATVASGGTLEIDPSAIVTGAGFLTVASGANLKVGSTAGINTSTTTGNVRTTAADTYNTGANYEYDGSAAQVTGIALPATVNTLGVNNVAGVTLTNAVTVSSLLALTSGDLSTGATLVTLPVAATCSGDGDVVSTGVGGVRHQGFVSGGSALCLGNPNNTIAVDSGTAPTAITMKLVKSAPSSPAFPTAVNRTYSITPTGGAGYSATLKLHYTTLDLNGNTETALELWRSDGSAWSNQGRTGAVDTVNQAVTLSGVTTFSDWTLAGVAANSAPTCDDPQSDSVDEDGTLTGAVSCDDADSDDLGYEVTDGPSNGTLTSFDTDTGDFTYEPNADYNGPDSFKFKANDGTEDSNEATFSITVDPVNDAPTCADDSASTDEDTPLNDTLLCSDIDGADDLDYEVTGGPSNGTLTSFDAETGDFTYEPNLNYNGSDSFKFKANDGTDDSNEATFDITVNAVNDAPTCDDPQSDSVDEDQTLSGAASCDDVDGDSLTYSVVGTGPAHEDSFTFNSDGTFSYTPVANYNGPDSFKFKANDGTEDSNEATFEITVNPVNDAPTCADDSASTDEDTPLNDTLACSDVDAGDDLDYEVTDGPSNGSLTSFDADTGDFTYEPNPNYNGPDSFKFKATDGTDDSNEARFDITINSVNDAPVAEDDAYSTDENLPLNVPAPGVLDNDNDVENDPFTAMLDDNVDHGTLTLHANGSFEYSPTLGFVGQDTFTYHANDGASSNIATVTITVVEADADNDGINNSVDCADNLADNHVVGLTPVPPAYTGGVHPTLQAAVNAASDNQVITMYKNTTENVSIGGNKDLRIVGCGHRVTAASASAPVIRVTSAGGKVDSDTGKGERDIHIDDLDVRGATSAAGYLVETSKTGAAGTSTILKAVRSESNSVGTKVAGNGNHLRGSNGTSKNSGDGIQVVGNSNLIEENDAENNGGDGLEVTGHTNTIKKNDIDNSGGDGIRVVGNGNSLPENEADGNAGDGFDISGGTSAAPNILTKNESGNDTQNKGNGYLIAGAGNGTPNPVELVENEATKNKLNGFRITGTGHELLKNKAQTNVLCEFSVVAGNFNSKDNKKNGTTVTPNTDGAAFPTACLE